MFSILLPSLFFLLLVMVLTAYWVSNGLADLRRPLRQLSTFLLDKAPAGIIDLFSKTKGSGSRTWLIFGAIWATLASTITFLTIWLTYDAKALDSFTSVGWSYNASVMESLSQQSLVWGFLGMTLIGAGLHINGRINGSGIGSEANASLMGFAWFGLTLVSMILPLAIEMKDLYFGLIELAYALIVAALFLNHLLALGGRGESPVQVSSWFIVMAHLSMIWALIFRAANFIIEGDLAAETEIADVAWFADRVVLGWFPLAMILSVMYYVVPKASGTPIWSRSLTTTSYAVLFISIPVLGISESSSVSGDTMLSFTAVMVVVGLIPLLAASCNLISTMQNRWQQVITNPGGVAAGSATVLLPIFALLGFFSALDALNGSHNMGGVQDTVNHGILWTIGGLIALSVWSSLFPEITGRRLSSTSKARWAFWLMLFGGIGSTVTLLMADFASLSLTDAAVETPQDHLGGYYLTAAAIFYAVVIATFVGAVNIVATLFSPEVEESAVVASVGMASFHLHPGTTSIRELVSRGVGVDTEIIVSSSDEEEDAGPTEIGVSAALHTDDGVVAAKPEPAPIDPLSSFEPELVDLARWLKSSDMNTIELFQKMDLDSDGKISPFEIREGLASLDIADLPPWDVEKMVSAMDLDGDGQVNIPELDIHMLRIMNSLAIEPDEEE